MKTHKRRVVVHFPRFGPYHIARIGAAADELNGVNCEVIGLEVAGSDDTYEWKQENEQTSWYRSTIFPHDVFERISSSRLAIGMTNELDRLSPSVIAICGYATADAAAALKWCRKNNAMAILMTETRKADGVRVWWKELLKSRLIRRFDAALCGGVDHRDYLISLGMPADRIQHGYDAVDNAHFAMESARYRRESEAAIGPYFLSSNRFIPRKNLAMLIEAYHQYTRLSEYHHSWPLVLLGDGEQKPKLLEQCRRTNLPVYASAPWEHPAIEYDSSRPAVFFPGFRQINELPRFYAHAGCFIHAALAEPWGLVLNEAMASSLPVLASTGTGAATDLIQEGVNGWRFDAREDSELAKLMSRIAEMSVEVRGQMGSASWQIVEQKCPLKAFGRGISVAIERAVSIQN